MISFANLLLFGRSNNYSPSNHAPIIPIRLIIGDVIVFKVVVRSSNGIFFPVVTECFEIAIIVVLAIKFKMYNRSFLLFHSAKVVT